MRNLSKMSINELRDTAVALGADRKKLYGTSKQSIIFTINKLREAKQRDPEFQRLMNDLGEYIKANYKPSTAE